MLLKEFLERNNFSRNFYLRKNLVEKTVMDISSTYHVDERLVRSAVQKVGAHKCLFGTDSPYAHTDAVDQIKKWVLDLPIPSTDKEKIFSTNFLELIS